MITMSVKVNRNLITPNLKRIQAQLQALPAETTMEFIRQTPIDTGNARRRTRLIGNRTIRAGYRYAQVLDKGRHITSRGLRGSKQAPRGMTIPTKEWSRRRLRQILRKR